MLYHDQAVFSAGGKADPQRLLSTPLSGGAARPFADLPGAADERSFAIDPLSGKPAYIAALNADSDVELFHLARK